jgi:hypothetical protein
MRIVAVRHESSLNNFFTRPFEVGMRHLKVALCDGSQKTLTQLAKERIIYRSNASENIYKPLTLDQRIFHVVIGTLETAGYITLVIPFVIAAVDRFFGEPFYPKGGPDLRTHIQEGGNWETFKTHCRKNPFGAHSSQDPFYRGAFWT